MCRKPTQIDDETQLYCDFGTYGWGDLYVVSKGHVNSFHVSSVVTDFAQELLNICKAVISNSNCRVALCDEPGGCIIEVATDKKQHYIMLFSIYTVEQPIFGFDANESGKLVLSFTVRRQRLIGMLMSELWKTHMFLRAPSYQKGRGRFPHVELVALNNAWEESPLGPSFLK